MEQPRIRRVPVVEPADVWFRVTTGIDKIKIETLAGTWIIVPSTWTPGLIHWGGFAAILGGVLWSLIILCLQWLTLWQTFHVRSLLPEEVSYFLMCNVNSHLLISSMALLWLSLLSM